MIYSLQSDNSSTIIFEKRSICEDLLEPLTVHLVTLASGEFGIIIVFFSKVCYLNVELFIIKRVSDAHAWSACAFVCSSRYPLSGLSYPTRSSSILNRVEGFGLLLFVCAPTVGKCILFHVENLRGNTPISLEFPEQTSTLFCNAYPASNDCLALTDNLHVVHINYSKMECKAFQLKANFLLPNFELLRSVRPVAVRVDDTPFCSFLLSFLVQCSEGVFP